MYSGINILQLDDRQNYYIYIIKSNELDFIRYSIYRNDFSNDQEQNIVLNSENIYINSTSYDENIKLKIENEGNILSLLSSGLFYDFDGISYDTKIYIDNDENVLNIKFNTTNYESKIEYYIIITENMDNNTKNITKYLYHKIINNKSFIYKNIINSVGIEPIVIKLNIDEFFSYDIPYIIYILGKENFGETFHYIYYEPKEFNFSLNENVEESEVEIEVEIEEKNDESTDEKICEEGEKKTDEESETLAEEQGNDEINDDEINETSEDKNHKNPKKNNSDNNVGLIVGIIFGIIGFTSIIFISYYCYKKRFKNKININNEIKLLDNNLVIN